MTRDSNHSEHLGGTDSGPDSTRPATDSSDGHPRVGESWVTLCAQAAIEQDPKRLLELVSEINRLLDIRRRRLVQESAQKISE